MNSDNAICYSNLIKINTSLFTQELSRHFKVKFLNTQSVRNKTTDICDHVMHANVDLIFLCETWLRPEGDESDCVALTPPGFCLRSFPRMSGAGGGLAVLYRNSLTKTLQFPPEILFLLLLKSMKFVFPLTATLLCSLVFTAPRPVERTN